MVPARLTRLAGSMTRRRRPLGACAACRATVFGDERHMTLHGVLVHARCAAYRRRT